MAAFIELHDNKYLGILKNGEANALEIGRFVIPDWANGVAKLGADDAAYDGDEVYMVANQDETNLDDYVDTDKITVAPGKYLRLKKFKAGDIFVTDQVIGTPSVGDVLAVNGTAGSGDVGKLIAVGTRTPAFKVKVIAVTTLYGKTAYKCVVL